MNPHDKDTNGKDTFEQDLQRAEAAYRQSGLDEPPELLNQAILNKAKRAVDKPAARPWSFGWVHATATTALVVLGLTLVNQQRHEMDNISDTLDQLKPAAPQSTDAASFGAASPALRSRESAQFRDEVGKEVFTTDQERRAAVAEAAAESESDQPDAGALSRQIVSELREADPGLPELHKGKRVEESPIPVVVPSRKNSNAAESIARLKHDQAVSGDMEAEPSAEGSNADNALEADGQLAGSASNRQIAVGNDDLREDKLEMDENAPASVHASKAVAPVGGQKIQEGVELKDQDSLQQAAERSLESQVDPETWLLHIRNLKQADPPGSWQLELQAFREIYPDYPVPEDLHDALAAPPEPE